MDITLDPIVSRRLSPFVRVIKTISGTDSLVIKAGWNLAVPNCWCLLSGKLLIVTSADVGNRQMKIGAYTKTGEPLQLVSSTNCAASNNLSLRLEQQEGYATAYTDANQYVKFTDKNYICFGDDYYKVYISNGFAGDVVTINLTFKWLNWDLGMMLPRAQKDSK